MRQQLLSYNDSLPDEISPILIKYGSLAHQAWYLKSLQTNYYFFEQAECIALIPVKNKIILDKAFIPPGIQRLDPISLKSQNTIDSNLLSKIIKHIPCGIVSWSLNIDKLPSEITKTQRNNYTLNLNPDYNQLRNNYNSSLKNSLNKHKHTVHTGLNALQFANFYHKNSNKNIPALYKNPQLLSNIITACIENKTGEIKYVLDSNDNPIAMAFFSNFNGRIVYLYSCSTAEGRFVDAMHAILDHTIQRYSGQNMHLDFEGSMIPGLAAFFQSFGAKLEYYYLYTWNTSLFCKLGLWLKNYLKFLKRN